jgi:hypothetical protein
MQELKTLGYAALLILAFVVGLLGTVRLSQALVPAHPSEFDSFEQPVQAPQNQPQHELPTIEC